MGWYEELTKVLTTARKQVTTTTLKTANDIHFTKLCLSRMKQRGLSEKDARDVYYHGSLVKQNMITRKYNGYELGIYFFQGHLTGQVIITSIWKWSEDNEVKYSAPFTTVR
jgi:hypothetical protein